MTTFTSSLTASALAETLAGLPALDLKAPELLKRLRAEHGQWLPVSPQDAEEIAAATAEMMAYMHDSQQLAGRLENLSPVPVPVEIAEFSL